MYYAIQKCLVYPVIFTLISHHNTVVSTVFKNITLIYTNFRINFRFIHCIFFCSECVEMSAVSLDGSQKLNVNFKHICLLLVFINYWDQQNKLAVVFCWKNIQKYILFINSKLGNAQYLDTREPNFFLNTLCIFFSR